MVKTYIEWINERDLAEPVAIELEAGEAKVYANPEEENWRGEVVRTEEYEDILKFFQSAIESEDDGKIKKKLADIRDLPLFAQDKSNAWKMSQIDGVERFRGEANYRRWLARYVVQKIKFFLKWAKNN